MGQQQLLLVILVTILVGIATVVAINVFGSAAEDGNRDAIRQDMLQAAAAAQAVWTRPEALGGAGQNFESEEISEEEIMASLNIPGTPGTEGSGDTVSRIITNENATYTLSTVDEASLTIDADPSTWPNRMQLIVCRDDTDRAWKTDISTDGDADDPCAGT